MYSKYGNETTQYVQWRCMNTNVFLAKYYLGDQIEEDELGETYTQERTEMYTGFR
jgi:hypothetical protein